MSHRAGPASSRPSRGRLLVFSCGLALTLAMGAVHLYRPAIVGSLDLQAYDLLLRTVHRSETSGIPVVVDIDEKSLAELGQWPWPRGLVAELLDRIRALGASSIGLDILFAESDRASPGRSDPTGPPQSASSAGDVAEGDRLLAAALSRGPFVLGYPFAFEEEQASGQPRLLHPVRVAWIREDSDAEAAPAFFRARGPVCNLEVLTRSVSASGFLNASPDADGVLRRVPLLIEWDGKHYPSLPLAALLRAKRLSQVEVRATPLGAESVRVGGTAIPVDRMGNLWLGFRGKRNTFRYVSAADILAGRTEPSALRGKIVFVGTSAAGLKERVATPLDPVFPGVEVAATAVDNILQGDFVSRPGFSTGLELIAVLAVGVCSAACFAWAAPLWSTVLTAAGAGGLSLGCAWVFATNGVFFSPLLPLATLAGNLTLLALIRFWIEERRARHRTRDLMTVQNLMMHSLTSLVETRDSETGGHILRTQRYVSALCERLASNPRFRRFLTPETVDLFQRLAPLHDIGKVGVPDSLLLKPGRLTPEEFEEVKKHAAYGVEAIEKAERRVGVSEDSFLQMAKDLVGTHHERWDGSGYPQGLREDHIPIPGRIMAVADVYDALTTRRVYKNPVTHAEAVRIIAEGSGTSFDPDVVDAFLEIQADWAAIVKDLGDSRP